MVNSQTFQDPNQRYFAGGLPRYQVIVAPQLHHASGRISEQVVASICNLHFQT